MYFRFNSNSCKTLLIFLISFSIIFQTHAAGVNWEIRKIEYARQQEIAETAARISAERQAVINGASVTQRSTALFSPSNAQIAKSLAKGIGAAAVAIAVADLIGEGVDWVMDPENNQIKYYENEKTSGKYTLYNCINIDGQQAFLSCLVNYVQNLSKPRFTNATCQLSGKNAVCYANDATEYGQRVKVIEYPYTVVAQEKKEKTLPLTTVAEKVKEKAKAGDSSSQQAVADSAQDTINNDPSARQQVEDQLDQNANSDTEEEPKPDPNDPDPQPNQGVKLPKFCSWAPIVCQASQVTINLPKTLTKWWDTASASFKEKWEYSKQQYEKVSIDIKDYFNDEPDEPEQEDPEIEEVDLDIQVTNYINGPSSCPDDRVIPLSMGGQSINIVISYQPLCDVAIMFKPAVILMSFLAGAFIITNTGRRAETGD